MPLLKWFAGVTEFAESFPDTRSSSLTLYGDTLQYGISKTGVSLGSRNGAPFHAESRKAARARWEFRFDLRCSAARPNLIRSAYHADKISFVVERP